jgi:Spy/CpxP family protein refolding chaperone
MNPNRVEITGPAPERGLRARSLRAAMVLPVLATLVLSAAPAVAQPRRGGGPPPGEAEEDLRETIEIYMMARMKRALDLSDEQQQKVIPLVQELSDARQEFNRERRVLLMRLRSLVDDPEATEQEIREVLDRLEEAQGRFRQQETGSQSRIRSLLTPLQQARFIFFQEEFRRDMEQRLRRLREMNGGAGAPGRPRRRAADLP